MLKKSFLLLTILLCFFFNAAPAGAADSVSYLYGTLEKEQLASAGQLLDPGKIVLTREWSKGTFNKKHYTLFVVKCPPNKSDAYMKLGFKSLEGLKISLRWFRVSNVNGWGTEVNGEVHKTVDLSMTAANASEVGEILKLSDGFLRDNMTMLKKSNPKEYASLMSSKPVVVFERGFKVEFVIKIGIENPLLNEKILLLEKTIEVGYYNL